MTSHADGAPFHSAESVLIDGANSVSGAPRQSFPHGAVFGLLAACAFVLALSWTRRRAHLVALMLAAAALPGLYVLLFVRADAPTVRGVAARRIRSTLDDLERHARWPSGHVRVVREDDGVMFPLGRYAVPSRPDATFAGHVVQLELRGSVLGHPCVEDGVTQHTVCGASP